MIYLHFVLATARRQSRNAKSKINEWQTPNVHLSLEIYCRIANQVFGKGITIDIDDEHIILSKTGENYLISRIFQSIIYNQCDN